MFKKISIVLFFAVVFSGCSITPKKSGIEVMSIPNAKVFIDGKEQGMTPYKNNSLKPGEITINLQTDDNKTVTKKVELTNKVNTVFSWNFGEKDNNGGYLLTMEKTGDEKKSGLIINVSPDKSAITIDGELKGFSPIKIDDIGEADKQITISFPGHKTNNLFVKAIKGYQLIVDVKLAEEEKIEKIITPAPTISMVAKVKIKETETGWLRVREKDNNNSKEIARVRPGESYEVVEENSEWVKININNLYGWISTKYVERVN